MCICPCILCVEVCICAYTHVYSVYSICMCAYVCTHLRVYVCMFIYIAHMCAYVYYMYVWCAVHVHIYACIFWDTIDCQWIVGIIIINKANQLWLQPSHVILYSIRTVPHIVLGIMNIPLDLSGKCSSKRKWYNPGLNWTSWTYTSP